MKKTLFTSILSISTMVRALLKET